MTPWRSRRTARALAALLVPAALMLPAACTGGEEKEAETPEDVLAEAKRQLDETSGVKLSLTAPELPDGVDGILRATGVGTHAPAFEGNLTVLVNSLSIDVPVVAVDGQVFARLPFTESYAEIDPADYGAPDPAALMATEGGVSSWLTAAEDVAAGEERRDGSRVLTSYTGTLPGDAVVTVIPSADATADFASTFLIGEDGRLDRAEVVGPFYGDAGEVEYVLELSGYGTDKEITKP